MKIRLTKNEKGLTLVEVLSALVILGIIFVSITLIFPQMTLFNDKTEAKLDTMNLARQEMAIITAQEKWEKTIFLNPSNPASNVPDFLEEAKIEEALLDEHYSEVSLAAGDPGNGVFKRFRKNDGYIYEADIYLVCEKYLNPALIGSETPPPESCEKADRNKLYKIHLKLLEETLAGSGTHRLSSETFSYIVYKAVDEKPPASGGG